MTGQRVDPGAAWIEGRAFSPFTERRIADLLAQIERGVEDRA